MEEHTPLAAAVAATRKDVVVGTLREAILRGQLPPGSPINESRIAEQLGVSRSPLREAIRELAEEGLIRSVSYKGATVAPLDAKVVEEIYSLRLALEEFAVKRLIADRRPGLLAPLEAIAEELATAADKADKSSMIALDLRFHRTLCELANHSFLINHWDRLSSHISRCMNLTSGYREDVEQIARNHSDLIRAIAGDSDADALQLLRVHILDMGKDLSGRLTSLA